jgi:hypothetical protein
MKHLGLVLVLCGAAGLAAAPNSAGAFEIQGENATLPEGASEFNNLNPTMLTPDMFKGNSLAMPFIGNGDGSGHVSDYGNAIPIPGPGIDQPAPAWALSPRFR